MTIKAAQGHSPVDSQFKQLLPPLFLLCCTCRFRIVGFSYMNKEMLILFLFSPAIEGGVEDMTKTGGHIICALWSDALL